MSCPKSSMFCRKHTWQYPHLLDPAVLALICYFFLPFPLEVRQVLTTLAFSPVCSSAVAYTDKIGGDVGLAGAINSCSIIISVVIITFLLLFMGI